MTLTEFRARTAEAFGDLRADHLIRSHHLAECGGRTAHEAIDAGLSVKQVWLALCVEFDVPEQLR
ncbi:DUF3046 domain-containing protein [Dietzia sp. ANT_WB102]|uniref:DUF3046 domain-containing protein n=1 Tax=Dietzia sp. ANT_WB102 TaxID=2597345 RepID=UPI0011EE9667|nr:DUF3046 domain-containing protein [Dietzia sp. ANT_WB102]KAA0919583.1 DUF3046 domain-containing protein [Dietzia sp. ANT_WB102]